MRISRSLPKVLISAWPKPMLVHRGADVTDRCGLVELHDQFRSAEEVDAVVDTFDEEGDHPDEDDRSGDRVPDLPLSHEINVGLAEQTHVLKSPE